jgi:HSP20 family protein
MKCSPHNRCGTSVFDELDRGLNQLMTGLAGSEGVTSDDPRLSLHEFENRYMIECDVPGLAIEGISLQLEDHILTIQGVRSFANNDDGGKWLLNERPASEFTRHIQLGRDVDPNTVDAELSAGVLRITVSKRPEILPRRIEIRRNLTQSS